MAFATNSVGAKVLYDTVQYAEVGLGTGIPVGIKTRRAFVGRDRSLPILDCEDAANLESFLHLQYRYFSSLQIIQTLRRNFLALACTGIICKEW